MTTPLSKERIQGLREECARETARKFCPAVTVPVSDLLALLGAAEENADMRNYRATDAWDAAIEEAAGVAECYEPHCEACPRGVANAIRALKEKP